MARIQILELPMVDRGDDGLETPFTLVIDQADDSIRAAFDLNANAETRPLSDGTMYSLQRALAERIGARAVLVFDDTIEIPANGVGGQADPLMRVADFTSDEVRQSTEERDALHAELGLAHGQLHSAALSAIRGKHANIRELIARAEQAEAERDEARSWARHGYEIGQRHCGWSDHGVAPGWLTEGWPLNIDSCDHAKQAAEYDTAHTRLLDEMGTKRQQLANALGMDPLRDWDDILNAARGLGRDRDDKFNRMQAAAQLHRRVDHRGQTICGECSVWDGQEHGSTDNPPVLWPCDTVKALTGWTDDSAPEPAQ